jgi:hypothetical protein
LHDKRAILPVLWRDPTEAEIPDHGRFVAKPYRAAELLGQVDDMIHKDNAPETGAWP